MSQTMRNPRITTRARCVRTGTESSRQCPIEGGHMIGFYARLLRLYPQHVLGVYGEEMRSAFAQRQAMADGRWSRLRHLTREVCRVVPDATAERLALLSSHPSLHGARPRDWSVIRPPGVGKREWFGDV